MSEAPTPASAPVISPADPASNTPAPAAGGRPPLDLNWVWREVRKRVFLKLPASIGVADALEAVVPIALEEGVFVIGFEPRSFSLSGHLLSVQVKNTIENILRQAAGRPITIEVVEGTSYEDWQLVRDRRNRAQEAVIAMAEHTVESHHVDDVLNQIVSEIRARVTSTRDRVLPQVRARLVLEVVPSLADAEEMLFSDPTAHDARRAMARALDRVASFLEVPPVTLAIEVERYHRTMHESAHRVDDRQRTKDAESAHPPDPV